MKRVVSLSLGSSEKDHEFETEFLGHAMHVRRLGADADEGKAWELLRRRKQEVLVARARAAEETRAALASNRGDRADRATAHLAVLDRELGLTEQSLDKVLAILRPGAEKQAPRRTREACVSLGYLRMMEIRRLLLESEVDRVAARVKIRRARFVEPETEEGRVLVKFGVEKTAE